MLSQNRKVNGMKRKAGFVLFALSVVLVLAGCGKGENLSDVEQYICDLVAESGTASSKIVLDSARVFSLKEGEDDFYLGETDPGKYVFVNGVVLWDNGAKDDFFHQYYTMFLEKKNVSPEAAEDR